MTAERLDELVNAWLDDALTDSDQAELESSLLIDSTVREQFWKLASLHGLMAEAVQYRQPVPPQQGLAGTNQAGSPLGNAADAPHSADRRAIPLLGESLVDWLSSIQFGSPRLMVACVVAGMGTYFASLLLSIAWERTWQVDKDSRPSSRIESSGPHRTAAAAGTAARLVYADDCQWKGSLSPPSVGDELKVGRLHLTSGIAEIEFVDGAAVRISGPTQLELMSPALGFLREGKLSARVPQRARNFAIETPTARVVDLGTAFVVEVNHAAQTRLAVIEGVVEVLPAQVLADGRRTFADSSRKQCLTVGQAMTVTRAPSGTIVAAAERFDAGWVHRTAPAGVSRGVSLPSPAANQTQESDGRSVLGTPGLVAYWRLGEVGGSFARDEVGQHLSPWGITPGTYHNLAAGDFGRPGALAGGLNTAVHFNGVDSYVDLGNSASLNGAWDGLTVAVWINPDKLTPESLVVGSWAMQVANDHFGLFLHGSKPLIAIADGLTIKDGMVAKEVEVVAHRWNFVVGTWDARSRAYYLYVDGRMDSASGRSVGRINANSTAHATIGGQASTNTRFFAGLIDEVTLFDRELSANQIAELYRLQSVSGRAAQ